MSSEDKYCVEEEYKKTKYQNMNFYSFRLVCLGALGMVQSTSENKWSYRDEALYYLTEIITILQDYRRIANYKVAELHALIVACYDWVEKIDKFIIPNISQCQDESRIDSLNVKLKELSYAFTNFYCRKVKRVSQNGRNYSFYDGYY